MIRVHHSASGARRRRAALVAVTAAVLFTSAACATHRYSRGELHPANVPEESLGTYISQVLAVSSKASGAPALMTVEKNDARLAAAIAAARRAPSADNYREVGLEYKRLGILDMAYQSFSNAISVDANDAAAYDLRARVWRDWGFPILGYADAYHAIKLAPKSAEAANTLGTLFEGAGNIAAARVWYQKALTLDARASYAMINLCEASVALKRDDAVPACEMAAVAAPASTWTRYNLAWAHALAYDDAAALEQFAVDMDFPTAQYNMGLVYMTRRQYDKAVDTFNVVLQLDPRFTQAQQRVDEMREAMAPRQ